MFIASKMELVAHKVTINLPASDLHFEQLLSCPFLFGEILFHLQRDLWKIFLSLVVIKCITSECFAVFIKVVCLRFTFRAFQRNKRRYVMSFPLNNFLRIRTVISVLKREHDFLSTKINNDKDCLIILALLFRDLRDMSLDYTIHLRFFTRWHLYRLSVLQFRGYFQQLIINCHLTKTRA